MAGHSKWHNIRHKKAAVDAKKAKTFTKLNKEISVAARTGGGDPETNPRLRTLVEKAKQCNMPSENVTRAIKKGTGDLPGTHYEEHRYEGYGPAGIAVIVEALTDNKNRTVAELRHVFAAHGGSVTEPGGVAWMFDRVGHVVVEQVPVGEDELMEHLLAYDVETCDFHEGAWHIQCAPQACDGVRRMLSEMGACVREVEVVWKPQAPYATHPDDSTYRERIAPFLAALEDHDDVQNVFTT